MIGTGVAFLHWDRREPLQSPVQRRARQAGAAGDLARGEALGEPRPEVRIGEIGGHAGDDTSSTVVGQPVSGEERGTNGGGRGSFP